MKKIVVLLFALALLSADMLNIDDFSVEVFSKVTNKPVSINMDLIFEGRYVEDESYKVVDALNVVVGSFYWEDLITSAGKEKFKETLKAYTSKKYSIDIDDIYIQKIYSEPDIKKIVKALKKEGMCIIEK